MAFLCKQNKTARSKAAPRSHIPKKVRENVLSMFSGKCAYCGENGHKLQLDHVEPIHLQDYLKRKHGIEIEDVWNYLPACQQCNNFKGGMRLEEFRSELLKQVDRAEKYSVNFRMARKFRQVEKIKKPIVFYFERKEFEG